MSKGLPSVRYSVSGIGDSASYTFIVRKEGRKKGDSHGWQFSAQYLQVTWQLHATEKGMSYTIPLKTEPGVMGVNGEEQSVRA
jgi:hypothetical protein